MIYLDNSSTTRPHPLAVKATLLALEENFGNPSSLHRLGLQAEKMVKEARQEVARLINATPEEIVFTSGGTESNHLALRSVIENSTDKHLITSVVEHPSVMAVFEEFAKRGYKVTYLPVDHKGQVDIQTLKECLGKDTALVSIMAVNNELGTIEPLAEISELLKAYPKTYFHVDAVQAVGKLSLDLDRIDLLSLSAHKIQGPKGIGALYVKKNRNFISIMPGGGQERGYRGGTENVPGIAGFGAAAEVAKKRLKEIGKLKEKKGELAKYVQQLISDCIINSPEDSPTVLSVSFPKIKGEVLVHALEDEEIYVSTGSACSQKKNSHPVLSAIGVPKTLQEGTIRFSFGWENETVDSFWVAKTVAEKVKELQSLWG